MNLGNFPWIRPASGTAKARKSNGFQDTISDKELEDMVKRNQAAHAIVMDVGSDAVSSFECKAPSGAALPEFDTETQSIFSKIIVRPLTYALQFARRDGYCALLVGYKDGNISGVARETAEIEYLQVIPKDWIDKIVYAEENGRIKLPLQIEKYEITIGSKRVDIDATRVVHIVNPTLDATSLEGESVLTCVYDLLVVLKSMDWGAGQSVWRHGGGLTAFVVPDSRDQQEQIDVMSDLVVDISAMTTLVLPHGTEMMNEKMPGLDPEPYYKVIVQQIAIGTRVPTSILTGSQAGTLTASMKDRHEYYELLNDIQQDVLTPALMEILNRFQLSNQLPEEDFVIEWEDCPEWIEGLSSNKGNVNRADGQ